MKSSQKVRERNRRYRTSYSGDEPIRFSNDFKIVTDWLLWWTAALLLMLATNPLWLVERVPFLPLRDDCLLSQGRVWNAPLASTAGLACWPFVLYAAVAAFTIACLAVRCVKNIHPVIVVVGVLGVCNVDTHAQLGTAISTLAAFLVVERFRNADRSSLHEECGFLAAALLVGLVAISITIDFGFPFFVLTGGMLHMAARRTVSGESSRESDSCRAVDSPARYRWLVVGAWFAAMATPGFIFTGYWAALFRPASWLWLQPPEDLLPSMAPIWRSNEVGLPHYAALLLLVKRWGNEAQRVPSNVWSLIELSLLSVMALGCIRYFWFSLMSIGLSMPNRRPGAGRQVTFRSAPGVCAAIAMSGMFVQLIMHGRTVVSADIIQRQVDPWAWSIAGPVVLTNLDQSWHWQMPDKSEKYQLVLSDRWETYAVDYPRYLAACEDWKEWRREAYLRSDGSWGGYQQAFRQWSPALVVVDSQDVESIRKVALDSTWKVLGIDQDRTIFGDSRDANTRVQAAQALRLLSFLELPHADPNVALQGTLAVGDTAGCDVITNVLTAMRMPLAALRILPEDDSIRMQFARASALLEIAYRTQRYSGQPSLVDHVRAFTATREIASSWRATSHYRLRIADAQVALKSNDVVSYSSRPIDDAQRRMRTAIANGDLASARELVKSIPNRKSREFFEAVLEADSSAQRNLERLRSIDLKTIDQHLRSELCFYIGCTAMETSEMGIAKPALEVVARDTASPFHCLARLYLSIR